jgi:hypothetical protein
VKDGWPGMMTKERAQGRGGDSLQYQLRAFSRSRSCFDRMTLGLTIIDQHVLV